MPIITRRRPLVESAEDAEKIDDSVLFDANGLNLQARTVASFLRDVNFKQFFEDAALAQFVTTETAYAKQVGDEWQECLQTDEGAQPIKVQALSGDIIAKFIDEDDLMGLFEHYLREEHPRETLEDRLALSQFDDLLTKPPFGGAGVRDKQKTGINERARLLTAALSKARIRRVGEGKQNKRANLKVAPAVFENLHAKMVARWIPLEKHISQKGKPVVVKEAAINAEKRKTKLKETIEQFRKQVESAGKGGAPIYEGAPNGRKVGPHLSAAALSGKAKMPIVPAKVPA